MNELSNKTQTPRGDDLRQEVQQQANGPATEQQGMPEGAYQQGLPPIEAGYPQYTPPGGYQQYGYQPYTPGQQQYGYQQQQQQYAPQYAGDVGPYEITSLGIKTRNAGLLCYLFGWVTGLIFLLLERENHFVRFHAMQSLLFFGILSLASGVLSYLPYFGFIVGALGLVMFVGWIVMMVKAHRGEYYKLPLFGDLAERLISQIGG